MENATILAVDDEEHILDLISYNLEQAGYSVLKAMTGEDALEIMSRTEVDLVLLDLMLPGIDGIEVLKKIRNESGNKKVPVLILTAKSDEISKVLGLEIGADDYLSKPFGIHELQARVKALLRRSAGSLSRDDETGVISIHDLVINKPTHEVTIHGRIIDLSRKEFDLLYLLASNRGRVMTRELLLERIWDYDYAGETRTVDVHVRNLRKKLEDDDNDPVYIKTVRGVGYKCI